MKLVGVILTLFGFLSIAGAQGLTPDATLEREVIATGLVHAPLPLDASRSFEAAGAKLPVVERQMVWDGTSTETWSADGLGTIALTDNGLELKIPTTTGRRAVGPADDPDYATYGRGGARLEVAECDWNRWNRIAFRIFPATKGARVMNLNLDFAGVSHLVNLRNGEWNDCFLDIENVERGDVANLSFGCSIKGREPGTAAEHTFYIGPIELQKVEGLDAESGWQPGANRIVYSTSGYVAQGPKRAIVTVPGEKFELRDEGGKRVFGGKLRREETTLGEFSVADFSDFTTPGRYTLQVGKVATEPFAIGADVWTNSLWRVTSFIFAQRCGHPVEGIHGRCHTDLFAEHNGLRIPYSGGWHDAGDLSQQTLQTADVAFSLLEAWSAAREKNPILAARLLEEARWGLDFVLRTRFGDGYRASSMGLLIWLDGLQGSFDDISSVRVHNLAYDNFLYAAYEATAAMAIGDRSLAESLREAAVADFEFAMKRHSEVGFGEFLHFYEHTYNTSQSQYMATVSWAASMLYRLTGEEKYADAAAEYIGYTLDCQRVAPLGDGTCGFFYRDRAKRSIVHYVHQSREQIYAQALVALCETQPEHADFERWKAAVELYGGYLKGLMRYTAPFGMVPSGVYHVDEASDTEGFSHLHLWPPANAREMYGEQIRAGVQIDSEHFVRCFPVWFSIFNGNTAVHLSTGKAAAICGKFLNDSELRNIGLEQMYWTAGKNPFAQSLIYGEGWNYTALDSFSSGEMTGAIPVGIRSLGNEDVPYWPRAVNACYKEVWLTSAGKWMGLAAEYF